jgi:hypothetical protein
VNAGHLEGEAALAAHFRHRNRLPHPVDVLHLFLASLPWKSIFFQYRILLFKGTESWDEFFSKANRLKQVVLYLR